MYFTNYHIHFVGIGGIGMSGIAELLLNLGYTVSGSDLQTSPITDNLRQKGAIVHTGHHAQHVDGASVVVASSAIDDQNPELIAAATHHIPVIPRAEMLAELMRLRYSIAVAGAHGKTSTTSIISAVLQAAGFDPTVVIGGILKNIGANALLGSGNFMVAEADESDGSFLKMSPTIAVVTNIDREHLDYYRDMDAIKQIFFDFIHRLPFYGFGVLCLDNEAIQELIPSIQKPFVTYGINPQADYHADDIRFSGLTSHFDALHRGRRLGRLSVNLAGWHNVANAMAALAVAMELGIEFKIIKSALETTAGVARRMEIKGTFAGTIVVDDYGHHPTEIKMTLRAVNQSWPRRRKVVVFQPHRYSRTRALFEEFTRAFYHCDELIVLPIYAAGEPMIDGVTAQALSQSIQNHGHKAVRYAPDFNAATAMLEKLLTPNDLLLTLGAGDVHRIGASLVAAQCLKDTQS